MKTHITDTIRATALVLGGLCCAVPVAAQATGSSSGQSPGAAPAWPVKVTTPIPPRGSPAPSLDNEHFQESLKRIMNEDRALNERLQRQTNDIAQRNLDRRSGLQRANDNAAAAALRYWREGAEEEVRGRVNREREDTALLRAVVEQLQVPVDPESIDGQFSVPEAQMLSGGGSRLKAALRDLKARGDAAEREDKSTIINIAAVVASIWGTPAAGAAVKVAGEYVLNGEVSLPTAIQAGVAFASAGKSEPQNTATTSGSSDVVAPSVPEVNGSVAQSTPDSAGRVVSMPFASRWRITFAFTPCA